MCPQRCHEFGDVLKVWRVFHVLIAVAIMVYLVAVMICGRHGVGHKVRFVLWYFYEVYRNMLELRLWQTVTTSKNVLLSSAGDMYPDQLRASAASTRRCHWTRDWDDWEANIWRRSRWLVWWLGSAWTNTVDPWHYTVTTSGITLTLGGLQVLLLLTDQLNVNCNHFVPFLLSDELSCFFHMCNKINSIFLILFSVLQH